MISGLPLAGIWIGESFETLVPISLRIALQSGVLFTLGAIWSPSELLLGLRRLPHSELIVSISNTFIHFGTLLANEVNEKRRNLRLRFAGSKALRSPTFTAQLLSSSLDLTFERLKRVEETRDLRSASGRRNTFNPQNQSSEVAAPAVELVDITLPWASEKFNLSVRPGEWIGLIGPSGCGKTTLLKVIAGLRQPASGAVKRFGVELSGTSTRERVSSKVQMLFQDPWDQILGFTPFEDLSFSVRAQHSSEPHSARAEREIIENAASRSGLLNQLHQDVTTLSFGERKRLGVAQLILSQPDVILCDEPTAGLDKESAEQIIDLLTETFGGKTVIWVTHDLHLLPRRLDRTVNCKPNTQ